MNTKEAKEIIAKFTIGYPVAKETLEKAYDVAKMDNKYFGLLKKELGLSDDVTRCEIFRERVDELSEMIHEKMKDEATELWNHLLSCLDCRKLYWGIGKWEEEKKDIKKLKAPIVLQMNKFGQIQDVGIGPPEKEFKFVAGAAAVAMYDIHTMDINADKPWEWELEDEEFGCTINLKIEKSDAENYQFICWLSCTEDSPIKNSELLVEARKIEESGAKYIVFRGPVGQLQKVPGRLGLGFYIIQIIAEWLSKKSSNHVWEISLELK